MAEFTRSVELWDVDILVIEYKGKDKLGEGSLFCIDTVFRGKISEFVNNLDDDKTDSLIILDRGNGVKNILLINNRSGDTNKFIEKFENKIRKLNLSKVGVVFFDLSCNNILNGVKDKISELSYRNRCEITVFPEGEAIKNFE